MRIAVCDDHKGDREILQKQLMEVWDGAEIDSYETGREIFGQIQNGVYYDLIFMDIFMGQEDGIAVGRKLHRYYPTVSLVYVSNSRDFGPEVFEVNALHYLVKPCDMAQLKEVKRRYLKGRESKVEVSLGRNQNREIPCHMITYVESVHNNLLIHLITGASLKIRGSIQGFMDKVDERFLRVNRGVLVNMEAIEQMNTDSCQVAGMIFMLSRKERAANKRRYNDWLFRMAMGEQ